MTILKHSNSQIKPVNHLIVREARTEAVYEFIKKGDVQLNEKFYELAKKEGFSRAQIEQIINDLVKSNRAVIEPTGLSMTVKVHSPTIQEDSKPYSSPPFERMLAVYLQYTYNDLEDDSHYKQRLAEGRPGKYKNDVVFKLQEFSNFAADRFVESGSKNAHADILRCLESKVVTAKIRIKDNKKSKSTSRAVWTVPKAVLVLYKEFGGYKLNQDDVLEQDLLMEFKDKK